jgi:hypothetical protein
VLKSSAFLRFSIARIRPKFKEKSPDFCKYMMVQARYQKIERDELTKFYFNIFIQLVAKIWLNLSMDHCHFGYII